VVQAALVDSPTLRAHSYSLLRTILETARTKHLIDANPCAIEGAGAASRKIKPRPLTIEELDVLVSEMPVNLKARTLLAVWGALRFENRNWPCARVDGAAVKPRSSPREWRMG
jgi:hypothetical protein